MKEAGGSSRAVGLFYNMSPPRWKMDWVDKPDETFTIPAMGKPLSITES
jgi:hypothetical protein